MLFHRPKIAETYEMAIDEVVHIMSEIAMSSLKSKSGRKLDYINSILSFAKEARDEFEDIRNGKECSRGDRRHIKNRGSRTKNNKANAGYSVNNSSANRVRTSNKG